MYERMGKRVDNKAEMTHFTHKRFEQRLQTQYFDKPLAQGDPTPPTHRMVQHFYRPRPTHFLLLHHENTQFYTFSLQEGRLDKRR